MLDYHVHTPLCRHAEGELKQYLQEAKTRGVTELGFADHFPLKMLGVALEMPVTMEPEELKGYVEEVKELAAWENIEVKLGIEVDYFPGKTETVAEWFNYYPFDYIIGSVHFIGSWDCTHPFYQEEFQRRPLEEIYRDYFSLIEKACYSGLFDIIAHVDAVKKFGYRLPAHYMYPYYHRLASVFKNTGVCLELNTSGWNTEAKELYPASELLRECLKEGVEVTLGSDAHSPGQVAQHFDRLYHLLCEEGVSRVIGFTNRRKHYFPLGEE